MYFYVINCKSTNMPVITTAAITSLVVTLAKKGLDKSFETIGENVSDDAFKWIKSLFKKNDKTLVRLKEKPESIARQNSAKSVIEISLEDDPKSKIYLEEILTEYQKLNVDIRDSKNVNIGNINSNGGNIQIGDRHVK